MYFRVFAASGVDWGLCFDIYGSLPLFFLNTNIKYQGCGRFSVIEFFSPIERQNILLF